MCVLFLSLFQVFGSTLDNSHEQLIVFFSRDQHGQRVRETCGVVETPQPVENKTKWNQKIYTIDFEMVCDVTLLSFIVWSYN